MITAFLPHRGEFGQMLMTYVRWVHGDPSEHKVVCCREGDEPLFPSAKEFIYDWEEVQDSLKTTALLKSEENKGYLQALTQRLLQRFPGATIREPLDGCKPQRFPHCPQFNFKPLPDGVPPTYHADVVVAPRFRNHGAHRNYLYWPEVITGLLNNGLTVALVGKKETSVDHPEVPECLKAWHYGLDLSVTLDWMNACKLVLATDAGMAHLAVVNQSPLKVIYGKAGVEAGKEEWKWTLPHMRAHAMAHCEPILGGWCDPQKVIEEVVQYIRIVRGLS